MSVERLSESRKRQRQEKSDTEDLDITPKRMRSSGGDTISYIFERKVRKGFPIT